MRNKFLKLFFSRYAVCGFFILLQVLLITFVVLLWASKSAFVYALYMFLSVFIVLWLFSCDLNPSYKMAWALTIIVFPLLGSFYFLFWQRYKLSGKKRKLLTEIEKETKHLNPQTPGVLSRLEQRHGGWARLGEYLTNTAKAPVVANTQGEYFPSGEAWFCSLVQELAEAEKFIFMEYFIIRDGKMWREIFAILKERAAKGVEVRFLYDDLGTLGGIPKAHLREAREAGIQMVAFNPWTPRLDGFVNSRDHRKICVIDGQVAYNGGLNIGDEYINAIHPYGHWKDAAVLIRGDGVWSFTLMFLEMWRFATGVSEDYLKYKVAASCGEDGFIQPYGDTPLDNVQVSANAYMQIISRAEKYVYIATPYLILDNETITALCLAARSGVDVRIITPGIPDKKMVFWLTQSFYASLLAAGVRIYQYTPGFLHGKMFVADDVVATVGTANMDYRSLYLHFECCTAFYDSSVVDSVKGDMVCTMGLSHEMTLTEVSQWSVWKRFVQSILRVFAPFL